MCGIDWQVLLEYLKVFLGWPTVVLLIVVFIASTFKNSISTWLENLVVEGDYKGLNYKVSSRTQTAVENVFTGMIGERSASDSNRVEAIEIDESRIPEDLQGDPVAIAQIKDAIIDPYEYVAQHKKISLALNYERVFMRIFGTQIKLLKQLSSTNKPITEDEIKDFHAEHLALGGATSYPFKLYVRFLEASGLIKQQGTPTHYRITKYGRDFLNYIEEQYSKDWSRPF